MHEHLEKIKKEFLAQISLVSSIPHLEELEQHYFSRKSGVFTDLMKQLQTATPEEKKEMGQALNALKEELTKLLWEKRNDLEKAAWANLGETEKIDVTQPSLNERRVGYLHPLTQVLSELETVVRQMGFLVEDGPELESDYFVYTSLNFPEDHPARESMDTFYIKGHPHWTMRSHVSNMQVRLLKKYGAPLRAAYPGRSFRNEATDPRHEHTFYQFEFLVVDRDITIAHMLGIIKQILSGVFHKDVTVRVRPKYYPFVEPGFNGEMECFLCDGKGCRVCKKTGWLEIFGSGLIQPNVLVAAGLNPKEWRGLACGMGLERLVMLKYGVEDIRYFHSGDVQFLKQF